MISFLQYLESKDIINIEDEDEPQKDPNMTTLLPGDMKVNHPFISFKKWMKKKKNKKPVDISDKIDLDKEDEEEDDGLASTVAI